MWLIISAVTATLTLALVILCKTKRAGGVSGNVPYPPYTPILGNALDIDPDSPVLASFHAMTQEHGPVYRLHMPPSTPDMILVSDPSVLRQVWNKEFRKTSRPRTLRMVEEYFGPQSYFIIDGPGWKTMRSLYAEGFHHTHMPAMVPPIADLLSSLDAALEKERNLQANNPTLDLQTLLARFCLDQTAMLAYGSTFHALDSDGEFDGKIEGIWEAVTERFKAPIPLWKWTPWLARILFRSERQYADNIAFFDQKIYAMIDERAEKGVEENAFDFLSLTMKVQEKGAGLTRQQIRDSMVTFLNAQTDTSASIDASVVYAVLAHPHVLAQIQAEVDAVLGPDGPGLSWEGYHQLEYTQRVVKETLRLYPPATLFGRYIEERMEVDGYVFEAGDEVTALIYSLHRSPDVYLNPLEFDPDRWLPDSPCSQQRPHGAFFAFTSGPRNCQGHRLSNLQSTLLVAHLFRNWDMSLIPGVEYDFLDSIILRIRHLPIHIRPRHP